MKRDEKTGKADYKGILYLPLFDTYCSHPFLGSIPRGDTLWPLGRVAVVASCSFVYPRPNYLIFSPLWTF